MSRTIQGVIDLHGERYHRPISVTAPPARAADIAFHHETRSFDAGRNTADCLDLVAEVDQLKARVADLERENARLMAENVELLSLQRRTAAAMRNAPMKALAPVAIPLAHTIASVLRTNPEHEGPVRVFYPDLAHAAGRSETTISRALVELDAYGLIDRHEETERKWVSDDRTREMRPIDVTRVSVDLKGTPEQFLANVAAYVPTKKQHGGYGTRCPHHPHADVIERRICQYVCSECGSTLEETSVDSIAFHDETGSNEPDEVTTPTADTPLQTAPPTSVVPLSVSVCKSPPDEGLIPSLLAPGCPKCATPSERQGVDFVTDDGRGRFLCRVCNHLFLASRRAAIPGRERFTARQTFPPIPPAMSVPPPLAPAGPMAVPS